MAADILIYKATHVPVGEDQKQHLELARDIAGAFNRQYDQDFFPLPDPLITGSATRVMSLRDGYKKMSKSEESDNSRINLTDSPELIAKKIKKAKSDMELGLSYEPEKRPEAANLINIYSAITGESKQQITDRYAESGFAPFKKDLSEIVAEHLRPISEEMARIKADQAYIDQLLNKGADKARAIAEVNIKQIKDIMGFLV